MKVDLSLLRGLRMRMIDRLRATYPGTWTYQWNRFPRWDSETHYAERESAYTPLTPNGDETYTVTAYVVEKATGKRIASWYVRTDSGDA